MNLKEIFVNILIAGLLLVSLIYFITGLSSHNQIESPLIKNPNVNYVFGNLSNQLNQTLINTEGIKDAFQSDTSDTKKFFTMSIFVISSIINGAFILVGSIITLFIAFFYLPTNVLGIPPMVANVLMGIVVISAVIGVWKLLKVGE